MDDAVSEQLLSNILLRNQKGTGNRIPRKKSNLATWAVAASLFLALGLTAGWMYYASPSLEPSMIPAQKWITKSTVKGAKLTFKLPDGSLVRLNANSSITFPQEFEFFFKLHWAVDGALSNNAKSFLS